MSLLIYKPYHRIPIKIGDAIIKVSPLTLDQKQELVSLTLTKEEGDIAVNMAKRGKLIFKYSIREVSGIKLATGEDYELEFENKSKTILTDECAEDFLNMQCKSLLALVLWSFFDEIKDKAVTQDGKVIKGVKILPPEGSDNIKK